MLIDWGSQRHMKNHPWQIRMKAAGLSARDLSILTGKHETTISRQFAKGNVEDYVKTIILAWEKLDDKTRDKIQRNLRDL